MNQREDKIYALGINYVMDILKGKWKTNIICALGYKGKRFSEVFNGINDSYHGQLSKKVFINQLRELELDGIVMRTVRKTKPPQIVEYSLTEQGEKMRALLVELSILGEDISVHNHKISIKYDAQSIINLQENVDS
jgi:DNA-binding HxlR family transcriptional regulator